MSSTSESMTVAELDKSLAGLALEEKKEMYQQRSNLPVPVYNFAFTPSFFEDLKNGKRMYATSCRYDIPNPLRVGEFVRFRRQIEAGVYCVVKSIRTFGTFREALDVIPFYHVLPGARTVEEAVDLFLRGVNLPTQQVYGVLVAEFELAVEPQTNKKCAD